MERNEYFKNKLYLNFFNIFKKYEILLIHNNWVVNTLVVSSQNTQFSNDGVLNSHW